MTAPADPSRPEPYSVEELVRQDSAIDFDRFGHAEAWQLGQRMVAIATERGLGITAAIWLGEQRVFQVGMPGTAADHDHWMERKAALVRRYNASSWLTTRRLRAHGVQEVSMRIGLDPHVYTLSGGAVPIRVHGSLVGVAVASGVNDQTEHDIVFSALLAQQRRA
ncbi:MAG: heme-binding protein [Propionibacterium sp.]|nr:heme-binding protein [Propionibacterium sp.]